MFRPCVGGGGTRSRPTTPHTPPPEYTAYCIVARHVYGQPDDGHYPEPKHVVVPNVSVYYTLKI